MTHTGRLEAARWAPWGRWTPRDPLPRREAHTARIRCVNGPLAGVCVAVHSWGESPQVPTELAMPDGGAYRLDAVYRWHPATKPTARRRSAEPLPPDTSDPDPDDYPQPEQEHI